MAPTHFRALISNIDGFLLPLNTRMIYIYEVITELPNVLAKHDMGNLSTKVLHSFPKPSRTGIQSLRNQIAVLDGPV